MSGNNNPTDQKPAAKPEKSAVFRPRGGSENALYPLANGKELLVTVKQPKRALSAALGIQEPEVNEVSLSIGKTKLIATLQKEFIDAVQEPGKEIDPEKLYTTPAEIDGKEGNGTVPIQKINLSGVMTYISGNRIARINDPELTQAIHDKVIAMSVAGQVGPQYRMDKITASEAEGLAVLFTRVTEAASHSYVKFRQENLRGQVPTSEQEEQPLTLEPEHRAVILALMADNLGIKAEEAAPGDKTPSATPKVAPAKPTQGRTN